MKKNIFDDILPIAASAGVVVEEGNVELIINDYKFSLTVQEYSTGTFKVLLDSYTTKARNMLKPFGVTFERKTKDEIHGDKFIEYVRRVYTKSNTHGGDMCSWSIENYNTLECKEF